MVQELRSVDPPGAEAAADEAEPGGVGRVVATALARQDDAVVRREVELGCDVRDLVRVPEEFAERSALAANVGHERVHAARRGPPA